MRNSAPDGRSITAFHPFPTPYSLFPKPYCLLPTAYCLYYHVQSNSFIRDIDEFLRVRLAAVYLARSGYATGVVKMVFVFSGIPVRFGDQWEVGSNGSRCPAKMERAVRVSSGRHGYV